MHKVIAAVVGVSLLAAALPAFASVDLSLVGGTVTVQQGQSYVEPGYSANSTVDGDITGSVVVDGINTSVIGTHVIGYSVTDSALSSAFASRTVMVAGGGGTLPYCSGPTAPGWRADLADGGCGGPKMTVVAAGTPGCGYWMVLGCVIVEKH